MAGNKNCFQASFTYTNAILSDFEALYLRKKEVRPLMRVVLGVLGTAGALYFGYMLYQEGMSVVRIGYLVVCSLLLLVALSAGRRQNDGTIEKYRKYYLDRKVEFWISENGVTMQLEKQKNKSQSKFAQIYGLYDTDLCFYFVIRGKAYYIISKKAISGGTPEELTAYMEERCKKKFMHYDLSYEKKKA